VEVANSPPAYRGHARVFLKDLEAVRPSAIIDIIHSGETFVLEQSVQQGMKAMREYQPVLLSSHRLIVRRNVSEVWLHVIQ
jgi:hypothetical protein